MARLPERFKYPDIDKFDGSTDPRIHLKLYVSALRHAGLTEQHLSELFYRYLTGPALRWFMSLDESRTRTFEDIATEFTKQYEYNTQLDVTLRELELTKQEAKESFSTFLIRWRAKAAQMVNRPTEREQIALIKKNLLPQFYKPLIPIPISTFRDLLDAGTSIEDELQMTDGTKAEGANQGKGKKGHPEKAAEVNAALGPPYHPNQAYQSNHSTYPQAYPSYQTTPPQYPTPTTINYPQPTSSYQRLPPPNPNPRKRQFDALGKPLSEVFSKLMRKGVLKPLDPRPLVHPLPPYVDPNLYCDFHQGVGHHTDQCRRLQYTIQELIDQKVIPPPQTPNITHNPLPNHYHQANLISTGVPFDPSHYIIPSTLPKPHMVIREAKDVCMIGQYDQGSFRDGPDNGKEPKSAKGKGICWWKSSKEKVEATLTFGRRYEPTKEEFGRTRERIKRKGGEVQDLPIHIPRQGKTTPNYGRPEPWFPSKKGLLPGFEVSTPKSPIRTQNPR